jgi:hypothetical protein
VRAAALAVLAAGLVLLAWTGFAFARNTGEPHVRGLITEVTSRDIGHADTIVVRAFDGRTLRFQVAQDELMTPGHLREHMTYGLPVTVYYRQEGNLLHTTRVED